MGGSSMLKCIPARIGYRAGLLTVSLRHTISRRVSFVREKEEMAIKRSTANDFFFLLLSPLAQSNQNKSGLGSSLHKPILRFFVHFAWRTSPVPIARSMTTKKENSPPSDSFMVLLNIIILPPFFRSYFVELAHGKTTGAKKPKKRRNGFSAKTAAALRPERTEAEGAPRHERERGERSWYVDIFLAPDSGAGEKERRSKRVGGQTKRRESGQRQKRISPSGETRERERDGLYSI